MSTSPPEASPITVERVIAPGGRNDATDERAPRRRFVRSLPGGRLRIALLAPPWIPIPPPGYGGIELVIAELAGGLVRHGHDVSLLAAPGSRSPARVVPLLERDHADQMGETLFDVDHVGRALEVIDDAAGRGRPFDIVHDHSGFILVAIGDRVDVPVLHTLHGPFTPETSAFYRRHADKVWLSGLSEAQLAAGPPGLRSVGAIPNPINLRAWPLERSKGEYLLWMGRMSESKGPHRAITAARRAGRPLILAGPVQAGQREFFEREVQPHIDCQRVFYVDEVGGERKRELFAHAAALLMPIRWPEPFGMVMIEAMACGTPVIAFPEGSAPEVVVHGRSGFLVDDEAEMASAVDRLDELDPAQCRAAVAERYDVDVVTSAYEGAYRKVIEARATQRLAAGAASPQPELH
jgi:glycosyltransferase involved in cell wall biosynthesis